MDSSKSEQERALHSAYLPGLDGLRAFAVLGVLLYHAGYPVLGGYLGVESFFVLSGFLITTLLYAEWRRSERIDIPAFWLRRARRLLPALLAMLAGAVLLAAILLPSGLGALGGDTLASLFYVMNWKLIAAQQSYFDAFNRPSLLQHLWSLAIEEQFYLVWPLLFALGMRRIRVGGLLLAIVAGALASAALMWRLYDPGSDPSRLYYGTDTRAAGLLIGAALALIWTPERRAALGHRATLLLGIAGTGALVGLLAAYGFMYEQHPLLYRGGFGLVALATALVVAATTAPGAKLLPALLEWAPLRWVGLRSYSLYLWHWPVFQLVQPEGTTSAWQGNLVRFGLTVALAEASYRFVERPIRNAEFAKSWGSVRAAFAAGVRSRLGAALVGSAALGVALCGLLVARQPTGAVSSSRPLAAPTRAATAVGQAAAARPTAAAPDAAASAPCDAAATSRDELERCEPTPQAALNAPPNAAAAAPALDPALAAELQGLLDQAVADGYIPGAVLSVSVPGYAPWTGASGVANRDTQTPMEPTTPVRIASVSKMFTAVVVMQLVEEGVLKLDAPLATYLPDSIPNADKVTIKQLLQHTSGLYDFLEDRTFIERMRRDPERVWQPQELVDYAAQFPVGEAGRWDYSSTNYVLLGMVVEKATGASMAEQVRERIFEPLNLSQAAFLPQDPAPANLAHGYSANTDITDASMSFAFATGNLAMTVEDLHRFGRALFAGELLRPETREAMLQFVNGRGQYDMPELEYGLGVMRNRLQVGNAAEAGRVLGHIGGYGGFRTAIWHAPESDVTIALGLNQSQADPNKLAAPVLDRLLASLASKGVPAAAGGK